MLQPRQDYMIIIKQQDKKEIIHLPDNVKQLTNMVPFKIVSIGPGRHENGVFIKTIHIPGDVVFINGGVIETKYNDVPIFFAREKDIVCLLVDNKFNY